MYTTFLSLGVVALFACAGCRGVVRVHDRADDTGIHETHTTGKRALNLPDRSDGLPFSHAVDTGSTFYVAGTLGVDPATGQAPADVTKEIRLMLESVQKKLALGGLTMDDLVWVQVFCTDLSLYEAFNEIYGFHFDGDFPARAFIGSGPLLRGARFEITGIAVRP